MNELTLLSYFTRFQLRIYEFPAKKEPDRLSFHPRANDGCKMLAPIGQRFFRFKMAGEDFKFLR